MKKWKEKIKYLVPAVGASSALMSITALAADGEPVSATDWAAVLTPLTSQISVSTVVSALATFIAGGIGLVFMWWGARKAVRTVMTAFTKGKLKI